MRKFVLIVLVVAGGAGYYYLWHKPSASGDEGGQGAGKNRPVVVTTAKASRKDVPIYLDGLGTVQAYNAVTIRSRVDGELVEVAYKEGQDVHAGDVLARIDPRIYQAQLDQAAAARDKDAAQLENAQRDLQRYIGLGDRVTGQSVDGQRALVRQLEATVRADKAQVDNAATMLSYTTIKAPFDGRTGIRQVDVGNIVHASDVGGLVMVTQIQPISVVFTLPQQTLPAVLSAEKDGNGKTTVIAVQADNKTEIDRGFLALVDNQIDTTTGTFKLKAVTPNANRTLWPGGFVNVRLLVSLRKGGLVIPTAAVQRGPQGTYAFVVKEDKTAEVRPIKMAASEDDVALIDDGLTDGETIVVEGGLKLKAGTKVVDAAEMGKGGGKEGGKGEGKGEGKHKRDGEANAPQAPDAAKETAPQEAAAKEAAPKEAAGKEGSGAAGGGEGRRRRKKETQ